MDYTSPQTWHSADWRQQNAPKIPYNGLEITTTPIYSDDGKLIALSVEVIDFTKNPNGVTSTIDELSFDDETDIPIPKLSSESKDPQLAADKKAEEDAIQGNPDFTVEGYISIVQSQGLAYIFIQLKYGTTKFLIAEGMIYGFNNNNPSN